MKYYAGDIHRTLMAFVLLLNGNPQNYSFKISREKRYENKSRVLYLFILYIIIVIGSLYSGLKVKQFI